MLTDARLYGLLGQPVRQAALRLGCFTVQELLREAAHGTYVEAHSHDLAVVQFSSGTTGHPRPIALTHANILGNAQAILTSLQRDRSQHSGVSWLPLYHDMGLIGGLVSATLAPGPPDAHPPGTVCSPAARLAGSLDAEPGNDLCRAQFCL